MTPAPRAEGQKRKDDVAWGLTGAEQTEAVEASRRMKPTSTTSAAADLRRIATLVYQNGLTNASADIIKIAGALEAQQTDDTLSGLRTKIERKWLELKERRDKMRIKVGTAYPISSGLNADFDTILKELMLRMQELRWVMSLIDSAKGKDEDDTAFIGLLPTLIDGEEDSAKAEGKE